MTTSNAAMDVAQWLRDKGLPKVFTDYAPEVQSIPYNDVVVGGYGGEPSDLYWKGEYPRVQVLVRCDNYAAGQLMIQQIYDWLHGASEVFINNNRYLLLQALQAPFFLKRDERNINHFAVNFRTIREIQ